MTPDMRACPECGLDAGPTITHPEAGSSVLEGYRRQIQDKSRVRESKPAGARRSRNLGGAVRSPGAEHASFSPVQRAKAEELRMDVETLEVLNLLLLHGGFSPLKKLEFHSGSDDGLSGLRLRISASPPVINPMTVPLADLGNGGKLELPVVSPDEEEFFRLDEAVRGQLELSLLYEDTPVLEESFPVTVENPNEWIAHEGLEMNLAGMVTPNAPAIVKMFGGLKRDFSAYQSGNIEDVVSEIVEVYEAIRSLGLKYIGVPPSFEKTGQKVLFPDEVIEARMGCCIDIAVLTAALLERAGYNPLIIIISGHAYSGVWVEDVRAKKTVIRDKALIQELVQDRRLLVWNSTTYFDHEGDTSIVAAIQIGTRLLEDFQYAIDIAACRDNNYKPLPRRNR